jgi:uncharacterized protein (TIGR01777 family)
MTDPVLWTLIFIQIAMGGFDTIVHHEATERLAWRPSQERELQLHGVRNLLYGVLFVTLGWFEMHGLWAIAVIVLLSAELLITLWDFVEEDLTRKLPASERINHTLLTLNYGAILVLLAPVFITWSGRETEVIFVDYGIVSQLATLSAIAVVIFGMRDLAAARRSARLVPADAAPLLNALDGRRYRVLVTGATGFIGRRLVAALVGKGHSVTVQTRDPARAADLMPPLRIVTRLDQVACDEPIDVIVNLTGDPITSGLWTRRKLHRILRSRLKATEGVLRLIERLEQRPELLINASAIGWYGLHDDAVLDEAGPANDCFSHWICAAWEERAGRAEALGVRVVCLRIGLVLGTEGGLLANLLTPFEFGLGVRLGNGRQWMSWISRDDLIRLIGHIAATPELEGPVNATAPDPVRNAAFTKALARALGRPALLAAPAWLLRFLAGAMAEEILPGGQRVLPVKALASGFRFHDTELEPTLRRITGSAKCAKFSPSVPAKRLARAQADAGPARTSV